MQSNRFLQDSGATKRIIFGAMYPCSSPRYVGHCSRTGALGEIQPVSFTRIHNYDFQKAVTLIREITGNPFAMNVLLEVKHEAHMSLLTQWCEIAAEGGCRFYITALGDPKEFVIRAHAYGAKVYHKVTSLRHAQKALEAGVDGLIATNSRAGGHLGNHTMEELYTVLAPLGLPLVCAGGIGDEQAFVNALRLGYDAVLIGTRGIASVECEVSQDYKQSLINATAEHVTTTSRVTGIPLSVIDTPFIRELESGPPPERKISPSEVLQAGKSVDGITSILPVAEIVRSWEEFAARNGV
jgi:nitronate monooxygenase